MFGNFITRISVSSASDLLRPYLPDGEPDAEKAQMLAETLKTAGWYTTPEYILDVWERFWKA